MLYRQNTCLFFCLFNFFVFGQEDIIEGLYSDPSLETQTAFVSELLRANQNKTNLEFRLRQLDASRITFINSLKSEVEESGISPTEE